MSIDSKFSYRMMEHHLVQSKVKYTSVRVDPSGGGLCTTVVFRSVREIDALIEALKELRKLSRYHFAHFHLQDEGLRPGGSLASAEITFFAPAYRHMADYRDIHLPMVKTAHQRLSQQKSEPRRRPTKKKR